MADRWTALLLKTGPDKEKANIVWNMIGSFCYAFASMVLAFCVMRIVGEEDGGIFAFGFSTLGQQMFILAYFGIRPFQVTDGKMQFSFGDYLHHRYITCILALLAGVAYLMISGYTQRKMLIVFLLVFYKVIDGFADVYESEFQRNGNLHLTGKSNTFRTVLTVVAFLTTLIIGKDLLTACISAVIAQGVGVILFDQIVMRRLSGVDYSWRAGQLWPLTGATVLLFFSVFLDFYIFSSAKYAIDANLNDVASGYFNIIFMPTSFINLLAGFIIRPVLTSLTDLWNRRELKGFLNQWLRIATVIGVISLIAVLAACLLGHPILTILEWLLGSAYSGNLVRYQVAFITVIAGGGFYAFLNLFYYILVIMRRQKTIFGIYVVIAVIAAVLSPVMVRNGGILGAACDYLILMILMALGFGLMAWRGYRHGQ